MSVDSHSGAVGDGSIPIKHKSKSAHVSQSPSLNQNKLPTHQSAPDLKAPSAVLVEERIFFMVDGQRLFCGDKADLVRQMALGRKEA